jgi:hypothetical protein
MKMLIISYLPWLIRHVLQEMTVDTFVPNDTDMGASGEKCLALSLGPLQS